MNFVFDEAGELVLWVHDKSMKCDVSFSQGSVSTIFRWGGHFFICVKNHSCIQRCKNYKNRSRLFNAHKCSATFLWFTVYNISLQTTGTSCEMRWALLSPTNFIRYRYLSVMLRQEFCCCRSASGRICRLTCDRTSARTIQTTTENISVRDELTTTHQDSLLICAQEKLLLLTYLLSYLQCFIFHQELVCAINI